MSDLVTQVSVSKDGNPLAAGYSTPPRQHPLSRVRNFRDALRTIRDDAPPPEERPVMTPRVRTNCFGAANGVVRFSGHPVLTMYTRVKNAPPEAVVEISTEANPKHTTPVRYTMPGVGVGTQTEDVGTRSISTQTNIDSGSEVTASKGIPCLLPDDGFLLPLMKLPPSCMAVSHFITEEDECPVNDRSPFLTARFRLCD